jgi:taurine dioxygenase
MKFELNPLGKTIGAEVLGLDLAKPLSEETRKDLYDSWVEHAVLAIRNQDMTPAQFADAARLFGDIMRQQLKQFVVPGLPDVGTISSRDLASTDGKLKVRGENYHTDHSNFPAPPKATTLLAVNLPDKGGDTQFVDVRAGFNDLSPQMKERILPLRSPHVYESSRSPRKMKALTPQELAEIPRTWQPLVIRHPDNGRAALYINTGRMEGVEGMPDEEAYALIKQLFDHATQARYEYRHKWKAGDMVIWDNRSVMHQANADYDPEQYRFLYRIMLKGAPLQPAMSAAASATA